MGRCSLALGFGHRLDDRECHFLPILKKVGRDATILLGMLFTTACFILLWALPGVVSLAIPAFVLMGLGWTLCLAPLQARLIATSGPSAQLALALNASAFFGGQGLGAVAGGAVYETFGPVLLPLFSLLAVFGAAVLFFLAKDIPSTLDPNAEPIDSR